MEQVTAVVREYESHLNTVCSADRAALYAEDATPEASVGSSTACAAAIAAVYRPLDDVYAAPNCWRSGGG
ncbi:hypothetical protein AB0M34_26675 [Nocardia sp. NPDC050193]